MAKEQPLTSNDPKALAGLMSLAVEPRTAWPEGDLQALWRHQLRAPLLVDLGEVQPDAAATVTGLAGAGDRPLVSFADLLGHPRPPLELLQLVKSFAKSQRASVDAAFPAEIATALYFASIALALSRSDARITDMDDARLRGGFQWAIQLPWIDAESRAMFERAVDSMKAG